MAFVILAACAKNPSANSTSSSAASPSANALDAAVTFPLHSADFSDGGAIPERHSCDGGDASPALEWTGSFGETKSFALIAHDPDARGGDFTHWVLFDVPATTTSLPRSVRGVGVAGKNDFDKVGYAGPCPPKGKGAHHYVFMLFALDRPTLGLSEGASRAEVEAAMRGHVLAKGELKGTFEH